MAVLKKLAKKMPVVGLYYRFEELFEKRQRQAIRLQQESFLQELRRDPRYADPRHLIHAEHQTFSQNGEDGIIAEIFRRLGATLAQIGIGPKRDHCACDRVGIGGDHGGISFNQRVEQILEALDKRS